MSEILRENVNFRQLWFGRLIANAGDSIYLIVLSWYMLEATGSISWVGIFNAAYFLPNIFSFLLGDLIDKINKKKLLIILSVGQLTAVIGIVITLLFGFSPVLISLFTFFASLFGMNTYTVQDVLIPKIVKKINLEKAQTYMNVGNNIVDNIFNALVGLLIKSISLIPLLNMSILALLLSILFFKRISYQEDNYYVNVPEGISKKYEFKEGFLEIYHNKTLLIITINLTIVNFFFGGFNVFLVKIANDMNDPVVLGLLNSAIAMGTLLGATVFTHKVMGKFELGQKLILNSFLFGLMLIITSFFVNSFLILLFLLIATIFLGVTQILINPILQSITDEDKLGKVFSAQYSISVGIMPIGSLIFGKVAEIIDSNLFFILLGCAYLLIGFKYFMKKEIANFSLKNE